MMVYVEMSDVNAGCQCRIFSVSIEYKATRTTGDTERYSQTLTIKGERPTVINNQRVELSLTA